MWRDELKVDDGGFGDFQDTLRAADQGGQKVRQSQDADDLAKAEGNNGQVVTPHSQHRDAQDNPRHHRSQHGKGHRGPEGQTHPA